MNFYIVSYSGTENIKPLKQNGDETTKANQKIFVIVLVVSITGVFIGFILLVILVYCCKNKMAARRREKEERLSNSKRLNWKIDNWFRQRDIESINRKIAKVGSVNGETTISRSHSVFNVHHGGTITRNPYRGDIVRSSISTPSVVDFRNDYACDNVFDLGVGDETSMSTRFTSLSRISTDNISNIATITSMYDPQNRYQQERYLSPLDVQNKYREGHYDLYSSMTESEISSVSQNNTIDRFYVREHRTLPYGLQWISPATNQQLFFQNAKNNPPPSSKRNENLTVDHSDVLNEYNPYNVASNYTNSSRNDIQHFEKPPEYEGRFAKNSNTDVDSDSGNYSDPKELDESGYSIFKQELLKRNSDASFYEIATKV